MENIIYFDLIPQELNNIILLYINPSYYEKLKDVSIFQPIIMNINFWKKLFIFNNIPIMNENIAQLFERSERIIKKFSKYTPDQLFYLLLSEYKNVIISIYSYERSIRNKNFHMDVSIDAFNDISFFYDNFIDVPLLFERLFIDSKTGYFYHTEYVGNFLTSTRKIIIKKSGLKIDFIFISNINLIPRDPNDFLKKIFLHLFYNKYKFDIKYDD